MHRIPVGTHKKRPLQLTNRSFQLLALMALALAGATFMTGWIWGHQTRKPLLNEYDSGPLVIAMQGIGQLHTVKITMKDVLKFKSTREPEGWLSDVPGVKSITEWATENEALVTAEGSVEAGVDLSKLTDKDVSHAIQKDGSTKVFVHLPPVIVFPANIHLRVENSRVGVLWKDENIVPKAHDEAERRFLEVAEKANIRKQAQDNAVKTLSQMLHSMGREKIEFTF